MKTVFDITPENAFEKELRALYLGGTDVAAICMLSDYKTPFQVWLEKTGQAADEVIDESREDLFWWGHEIEPLIVKKWLLENPDWEVLTANEFVVDPEYSFLCMNTDRRIRNKVTGETAILECKTVASSAFKHWKLGVPLNYYTQGQHYLGISGLDRVIFALFVMDSRNLQSLDVYRDEDYIAETRGLAIQFWEQNVVGMVAPDKTVFDWTKTEAVDESVIATPEVIEAVALLKGAKSALKQAEETVKGYEETVKLHIQDKKVLLGADSKTVLATWNGSNVTRSVSSKIIAELVPDRLAELTKTGYERKFLVK